MRVLVRNGMFTLIGLAAVACIVLVVAVSIHAGVVERGVAPEAQAFNRHVAASPMVRTEPPVVVTVISDEYTAPSRSATPVPTWPLILSRQLDQRILSLAAPGAGYTIKPRESEFGGTFKAVAQQVASTSKVVVFFGGSNDLRAKHSRLMDAAVAAIASSKSAAPNAKIVVVGPASTSKTPSSELLGVNTVLKKAAATGGARFVDALAGAWLSTQKGMVREDGVNLSAKAERVLAQRLAPVLMRATG